MWIRSETRNKPGLNEGRHTWKSSIAWPLSFDKSLETVGGKKNGFTWVNTFSLLFSIRISKVVNIEWFAREKCNVTGKNGTWAGSKRRVTSGPPFPCETSFFKIRPIYRRSIRIKRNFDRSSCRNLRVLWEFLRYFRRRPVLEVVRFRILETVRFLTDGFSYAILNILDFAKIPSVQILFSYFIVEALKATFLFV